MTPQGTGAAGVQIVGLDANRKTQTEFVALDGTATVTTTSTWLGINRAAAVYAGSAQSNVGNITITHTTGGQVLGYIPAGDSVTQQMIYHTQNQARGLVDWLYLNFDKASGGGNPTVNVRIRIFNPLTNIYFLVYESVFDTSVTQIVQLNPQQPFQTSPGDVLLLEASTSANNTVLYGRFSLIEVQDADYNPSI